MYERTLAQVLVDFEDMSAYLILSNPWGNADESSRGVQRVPEAVAGSDAFARIHGGGTVHSHVKDLPPHLRVLVGGAA